MLTVIQFGVVCGLICYAVGVIVGYRAGKDLWRCKHEDRCRSNAEHQARVLPSPECAGSAFNGGGK